MTQILFIFILALTITSLNVFADEILIIDSKRNIPLSDEETVYKDFYINAGENAGLKKNLVVSVKRQIKIKDSAAKSIGEFETLVGKVRIIHAENKVAIGREYQLQNRDEDPMLEQVGLMTGDRIDLKDSFIDNTKHSVKKAPTSSAVIIKQDEPIKPKMESNNEILKEKTEKNTSKDSQKLEKVNSAQLETTTEI